MLIIFEQKKFTLKEEYRKYLELAVSRRKENKRTIQKLKRLKSSQVNSMFHSLHHEAFEIFDCLECANCCSNVGPRIADTDINRISRSLKVKPSEFVNTYLTIDEDKDYIMKSMPCPFLLHDNYCSIYEIRPKACKGYPHTDHLKMSGILNLTLRNAESCPAVCWIFEKLSLNH